jgi:hypothetical protein
MAAEDRDPEIVVEAPEDVDVTPTVEKTSPQLPPPPTHDPYRVTFIYPDEMYGAQGTQELREAARRATGDHLVVEIDHGLEVDELMTSTVRKVAREEGVRRITVRVSRRG